MQPEGNKKDSTIRNLGMTKSTNAYANNPIIVEDIFDVFTRHVDQMSSYNGLLVPLSDLHKLLNYKDARGFNDSSIQERIKTTLEPAQQRIWIIWWMTSMDPPISEMIQELQMRLWAT